MSFDWDDPEERRRYFLTLRVKCDDVHTVTDDMLAPPRARELGPATHREKCHELWDAIYHMIDYALASSGGTAPGGAAQSGDQQADMEPVGIHELVKFGEDRGRKKGLKKGLERGREQGITQGREQGRQAGEREALRRVLAVRKLPLSAEQDRQIDACTDLATLRRWLDQAIFAESAAEALR